MYDAFFGFRERPFQLVPNPAYLFLSRSHQEALAHLIYAVAQGEGFVAIIGEAGTGKTTLCRAFLAQLTELTEAAYIFNPRLEALELIKAINDELGIDSSGATIKELIDVLNAFLLQKRAEGKGVVLLIDEAQNLSRAVLEQLRLLSNLETSTTKLLQIILVGQPELAGLLASHELRQLQQRITLSCHLAPLTPAETRAYVEYRLRIAAAGGPGPTFSRGALRVIYRFSGGIPRLINVVCDRALLCAFGHGRRQVGLGVAREAVRELTGGGGIKSFVDLDLRRWLLVGAAGIILALALIFQPWQLARTPPPSAPVAGPGRQEPETSPSAGPAESAPADQHAADQPPEPVAESKPAAPPAIDAEQANTPPAPLPDSPPAQPVVAAQQPEPGPAAELSTTTALAETPVATPAQLFGRTIADPSRAGALAAALTPWGEKATVREPGAKIDDQSFFESAAAQAGFMLRRFQANLHLLRNINLPAVLKMDPAGNSPGSIYLALVGIKKTGEMLLLDPGSDAIIAVTPRQLEAVWSGVAFVPWKDFLRISDTTSENGGTDGIAALKDLLRNIGFAGLGPTPVYDEPARAAVAALQKKHGINVDGMVGSSTKIVLYNQVHSLPIPHIMQK